MIWVPLTNSLKPPKLFYFLDCKLWCWFSVLVVSHQSLSFMPESGLGGWVFFFKWTNKQNYYPLTEFLLCFSSSNLGHTSVNSQKTWQSYTGSLKGSFCMLKNSLQILGITNARKTCWEWYCTCHKSRLRHNYFYAIVRFEAGMVACPLR